MGVPKRKTSKARRDKRRTHQRLGVLNLGLCPQCGATQLPHHICQSCGSYKGKEIIAAREV